MVLKKNKDSDNRRARQNRASCFIPSSDQIRYFILSLGCSKNLVESEKLNAAFSKSGFVKTEKAERADLIIINTCGFIEDAKRESIDAIFDAINLRDGKNIKGKEPVRVAVTGCLSERYLTDLRNEIPEADLIWGKVDEPFVIECAKLFNITNVRSDLRERIPFDKKSYEYIKISDGCSNGCSYCAIPLIRGVHRSFSPESILRDVDSALSRGAKEIVIIAQDIAVYNYNGYLLKDLLYDLRSVDIPWIRLLYCHPDHLTDEIITAMSSNPRIVPYIDIPFQHASAKILSAMNRKGSGTIYLDLLKRLRNAIPDIAIRSTFMTGFPGETEQDFKELIRFVENARLDRVGSFTYSPEENTAAADFPQIDNEISVSRRDTLMDVQLDISRDILESRIGSKVKVLVEEHQGKDVWLGRTQYDAPEVDGVFFLTTKKTNSNDIVVADGYIIN